MLESYKACCCDDRCESVETSQTPITYSVYGFELQVALCANRGKTEPYRRVRCESSNLVHSHQHIFRTFLKSSPQDTNPGWQGHLERIRNTLHNNCSRKCEKPVGGAACVSE